MSVIAKTSTVLAKSCLLAASKHDFASAGQTSVCKKGDHALHYLDAIHKCMEGLMTALKVAADEELGSAHNMSPFRRKICHLQLLLRLPLSRLE